MLKLTRDELYAIGVEWTGNVLDLAGMPPVRYQTEHSYFEKGENYWGMKGFYRRGTVFINLPRCRPATRTPGYSWSFPGYKADLTPVGVVAHEVGHYIDEQLNFPQLRGWSGERSVTSYEPNRRERFAEAVKLFITNPDLLRVGRPVRHALLLDLGLRPLHDAPWRDVLRERGAHERFFDAAQKWISDR